MRVDPKTEKEIAEEGLLTAGEYDFEVTGAEETESKKGNEMVALKVRVFDMDGRGHQILDWLVSIDSSAYKNRHFAEATGLLDEYESGNLPASIMIGKTGRCKVVIKKDTTGQYGDKNGIADYLKPKVASTRRAAPAKSVSADLDDEIPF